MANYTIILHDPYGELCFFWLAGAVLKKDRKTPEIQVVHALTLSINPLHHHLHVV